MPIKIKHKDTNKISDVPIEEWNSFNYYKQNYVIISQTDIVHVWMVNNQIRAGRQDMGLWEKSHYLTEVEKYPNRYFCKSVDDLLLTIEPNVHEIAPQRTNAHAGISLWKKSKNIFNKIYKYTKLKQVLKFSLLNILKFIFWVSIGIAIWYFTVKNPIIH